MELKTTKEIVLEGCNPKNINKKWVAVDEIMNLIDDELLQARENYPDGKEYRYGLRFIQTQIKQSSKNKISGEKYGQK